MSKKLTEAKRAAIQRYDAANTKQIKLKLNINTDYDLISWLERIDNVQGYIKALVNRDRKMPPHLDSEIEEYTGIKICRFKDK